MMENLLSFLPDFVQDAVIDSVSLIPFLFVVFVFIELFENYFAKKIIWLLKYSEKIGPVIGALFAIIPQCGFSIVASLLYVKKFISIGTLLAVYIATSDEAIPILLAKPNEFMTVAHIIVLKLVLAIMVGYLTDFFVKNQQLQTAHEDLKETEQEVENEHGCCNHSIHESKLKSVILHPIKHTLIIFGFILAVCLCLNYAFEIFTQEKIEAVMLQNSLLQPVIAGIFGLIPNCAVSVLLTMMYLQGVLSFGSVIAGLSSGAGLGLLVLLKKNEDKKNTALVVGILLAVSVFAGVVLQIFVH